MATAAPTLRDYAAPDVEIDRARTLVRALDRFYLDPILGFLVPGVGDVVGSLLGLYPVAIALRRRLSLVIVARMLLNLAVDALLGVVPVLGDLVDFGFKANTRNLELLQHRVAGGGKPTARDYAMVIGAAVLFLAAVAGAIYLISALVRAIGGA
jgi:hypothetical protein